MVSLRPHGNPDAVHFRLVEKQHGVSVPDALGSGEQALLMGKTKAAVLSLLGPPDDTAGVHQEWLEYRTRNIPGTSVTRYDIRFENDKVVEFEGHSH